MKSRLHAYLALFCILGADQAAAADNGDAIGSAVTVVNLVTAELSPDTRSLRTGDDVRQDEVIQVSPDGLGEIELVDQTKLALGPGSVIQLDKFVYDPDKTGGSIVLNLAKGAFRFVTGVASKPSYVINTPTASITVRGTVFDAYIHDDGAIWLLLHEGAIQVCNSRNQCQVLDNPCNIVRVTGQGGVGAQGKWASGNRDEVSFETAFPFVVTPPQIDPNPLYTRRLIEEGRCPDSGTKPRKIDRDASPPPTRKTQKSGKTKEVYIAPKRPKVVYVKPTKPRRQKESYDDSAGKAVLGIGAGILIGKSISGGRNHKY